MSSTFAQLRTKTLGLENQLSGKLAYYSEFATAPGSRPSSDETRTKEQIEALLTQMTATCAEMQRIIDSDPSISTSKMQQVSRHKENLNQFRLDYARVGNTIQEERNRLNLMSSIRDDIQDRQDIDGGDSNAYMMDERLRIDRQHGIVDGLLAQVLETRDDILSQRSTLRNMGNKLQRSLATMPGINVLLGKINTRRRRDQIIIASVITFCIILLWWAM